MVRTAQKAEEMILRAGKNKRGFLLLEVMVSVAMLSIGIVMVSGSFMNSIKAIDLSEDYFRAGLLFEEKIYEVSNSTAVEGLSSGVFADFNNRFSWNMNVIKSEQDLVYEFDLQVSWDQGAKMHELSVVTYLL